MAFDQELKKWMRQKEVTQKQLSDLTGIGKSSISQYISGKNEPSEKNKQKLMDALDIPVSYCSLESNEKINDDKIGNVPISVAAKKMGKSEQFIRVGLQRGVFDFGYAVKMSSKYSYHISPSKFKKYIGE
ncbi:helix-turn-helix transcriptional regulator [Desemzia sp. C1]|uniref:helix-turn-helix domain-containing protein n=1 Tax=Desemzia sp. C1 TaxID=2892016 RepID=UPI001E56E44D|nr:helix-turn-helix transcriptional regulator [Desemzia sp. C1]MCI3029757.1 helix-turn-helix transcriptional regulator [Desemzia sp. C1]